MQRFQFSIYPRLSGGRDGLRTQLEADILSSVSGAATEPYNAPTEFFVRDSWSTDNSPSTKIRTEKKYEKNNGRNSEWSDSEGEGQGDSRGERERESVGMSDVTYGEDGTLKLSSLSSSTSFSTTSSAASNSERSVWHPKNADINTNSDRKNYLTSNSGGDTDIENDSPSNKKEQSSKSNRDEFESRREDSKKANQNNGVTYVAEKEFTNQIIDATSKEKEIIINIHEILESEKTRRTEKKYFKKENPSAYWEFNSEINDLNYIENNGVSTAGNRNSYGGDIRSKQEILSNSKSKFDDRNEIGAINSRIGSTVPPSLSTSSLRRVSACESFFLSVYFYFPSLRRFLLHSKKDDSLEMKKKKIKKLNEITEISGTNFIFYGRGHQEIWKIFEKMEMEIKLEHKTNEKIISTVNFDCNNFMVEIENLILNPFTYFSTSEIYKKIEKSSEIKSKLDEDISNLDYTYLISIAKTILKGEKVIGKSQSSIEFAIEDGKRISAEYAARKEQSDLLSQFRTEETPPKNTEMIPDFGDLKINGDYGKTKFLTEAEFEILNGDFESVQDPTTDDDFTDLSVDQTNHLQTDQPNYHESNMNVENGIEKKEKILESNTKEKTKITEMRVGNDENYIKKLDMIEKRTSFLSEQRHTHATSNWEDYERKMKNARIHGKSAEFVDGNDDDDGMTMENIQMLYYLQTDDANENENGNIQNNGHDNNLGGTQQGMKKEKNSNAKSKDSRFEFTIGEDEKDCVIAEGEFVDEYERAQFVENEARKKSGKFRCVVLSYPCIHITRCLQCHFKVLCMFYHSNYCIFNTRCHMHLFADSHHFLSCLIASFHKILFHFHIIQFYFIFTISSIFI